GPTSARAAADRPRAPTPAPARRRTRRRWSWSTPGGPCGRRSRSSGLLRVGDECGHPVEPPAPQLLVSVEQASRTAQALDVGADDLAAPDAHLGHQAGPFEDGDVLLPGLEAHRVVLGQLGD